MNRPDDTKEKCQYCNEDGLQVWIFEDGIYLCQICGGTGYLERKQMSESKWKGLMESSLKDARDAAYKWIRETLPRETEEEFLEFLMACHLRRALNALANDLSPAPGWEPAPKHLDIAHTGYTPLPEEECPGCVGKGGFWSKREGQWTDCIDCKGSGRT